MTKIKSDLKKKIRTINIDEGTYQFYKEIGDGCFSKGVRKLSAIFQTVKNNEKIKE